MTIAPNPDVFKVGTSKVGQGRIGPLADIYLILQLPKKKLKRWREHRRQKYPMLP